METSEAFLLLGAGFLLLRRTTPIVGNSGLTPTQFQDVVSTDPWLSSGRATTILNAPDAATALLLAEGRPIPWTNAPTPEAPLNQALLNAGVPLVDHQKNALQYAQQYVSEQQAWLAKILAGRASTAGLTVQQIKNRINAINNVIAEYA